MSFSLCSTSGKCEMKKSFFERIAILFSTAIYRVAYPTLPTRVIASGNSGAISLITSVSFTGVHDR